MTMTTRLDRYGEEWEQGVQRGPGWNQQLFLPAAVGSFQPIPSYPKALGEPQSTAQQQRQRQHTPWRGNTHTAGKRTAPPPPGPPWPPHWLSACRRTATPWSLQGRGRKRRLTCTACTCGPPARSSQDSTVYLATCWGSAWHAPPIEVWRSQTCPRQSVTLAGRAGEQTQGVTCVRLCY